MRQLARSIAKANMKRAGFKKINRYAFRNMWRAFVVWHKNPKQYIKGMRARWKNEIPGYFAKKRALVP
jgi:hypothetical protein